MMIDKLQQQIKLQDGGSPSRGGKVQRRRLGSGGGRIVDPRQISSTSTISNADILKGSRNTTTATVTTDNDDELSGGGRLDIIDLSGLFLDALPNPNINLAAICKLDLSNNHLQNIPESLTARLLNVVVLDVHSNQLTSLPNSIGCLSKLKVLNVSGNLLSSLPRSIEDCRSLEELNANFNKLTSLPDTIGFELINLKKLSVNSNKLILLPYSTSHLTSLRVLDVRLNCLRSLPDDLENLINLEILNVSQNFQYLTTLPYSTGLLLSLIELDASYNNISALPDSLGCLKKLQKLCVEGNPLVSPSMDVVDLGLHAVRQYLAQRINTSGGSSDKTKKKSWFGKLKKHATINGRIGSPGRAGGFTPKRNGGVSSMFEAVASPRYNLGMFSPKRLFSSSPQKNNYFSKLG